jgi:hypothetical protein
LLRYGVGVVDELEKIRSSLSRKFGCRCTITCAGGSASFGGSTSTGVHGAGAGDAQAQSTAVSISDIAPALCILVGHLLGMVLSYRCEVGGMRGFIGACRSLSFLICAAAACAWTASRARQAEASSSRPSPRPFG